MLLGALAGSALVAGLAAWIFWPAPPPAPPTAVASSGAKVTLPGPAASASAFPPPRLDLPASRLHQHVDGAEPVLQKMGCRRLLVWRIEAPPADLEVMAFDTEKGARSALERDAGSDRNPGVPGDEGWQSSQCVYFRHGTAYVRLIADQPAAASALLQVARRVERALSSGEIRP